MLTFAEEVLLLLLDDEKGTLTPLPQSAMECAMAGAALMDLAFLNRIDTDLERLTVLDPSITGIKALDHILAILSQAPEIRSAKSWIETLSRDHGDWIREQSLESLIVKGILREQDRKFLWVFSVRRYPVVDGKPEREVKLRIIEALLSDQIPDPRDIALICLSDACDILSVVLPEQELQQAAPRIEQLRKMDLIGRELFRAVTEIETSIALAISQAHYPPY